MNYMSVAEKKVNQAKSETGSLVLTWIASTLSGYKIDRSTNPHISKMGQQSFKTIDDARMAVVRKAVTLGIPQELVLFPDRNHP